MMRATNLKVLNDGMREDDANHLFDRIEGFSAYAFNKSHSVAYTVISYQTMWLKQKYQAEFFASALSIADKEERLMQLVTDAKSKGIIVVPPDINISSSVFEIRRQDGETTLYTPFNKILGVSDLTTSAILDARKSGEFISKEDFLKRVNKTRCNRKHQQALELVGAFSTIDPESLPRLHPDRIKDQITLLPGLMIGVIKADRNTTIDNFIKGNLLSIMADVKGCQKCNLNGGRHPMPSLGKKVSYMVVTDHPNISEDKDGKMLSGKASDTVRGAIRDAELPINEGYFTSLVKSIKSEKILTTQQITSCSGYLTREIEIIKPPIIIALGSYAVRYFAPEVKGSIDDVAGTVVFNKSLDASIILGFSPGSVYYNPSKYSQLVEIFKKVAEMIY